MSKSCVDGYIRCPDWDRGRYVWRKCAHPVHDTTTELGVDNRGEIVYNER